MKSGFMLVSLEPPQLQSRDTIHRADHESHTEQKTYQTSLSSADNAVLYFKAIWRKSGGERGHSVLLSSMALSEL